MAQHLPKGNGGFSIDAHEKATENAANGTSMRAVARYSILLTNIFDVAISCAKLIPL